MPSSPFLAISFLAQEAVVDLADLESMLTHGPAMGATVEEGQLVGLGMQAQGEAPPSLWPGGLLFPHQVSPHL